MQRHRFQHDAVALSYLDAEGDGRIVIALHAHWMEGIIYEPLAAALAPAWRVIALDQRGHGYSGHAGTYDVGMLAWRFWTAATSFRWTILQFSRRPLRNSCNNWDGLIA